MVDAPPLGGPQEAGHATTLQLLIRRQQLLLAQQAYQLYLGRAAAVGGAGADEDRPPAHVRQQHGLRSAAPGPTEGAEQAAGPDAGASAWRDAGAKPLAKLLMGCDAAYAARQASQPGRHPAPSRPAASTQQPHGPAAAPTPGAAMPAPGSNPGSLAAAAGGPGPLAGLRSQPVHAHYQQQPAPPPRRQRPAHAPLQLQPPPREPHMQEGYVADAMSQAPAAWGLDQGWPPDEYVQTQQEEQQQEGQQEHRQHQQQQEQGTAGQHTAGGAEQQEWRPGWEDEGGRAEWPAAPTPLPLAPAAGPAPQLHAGPADDETQPPPDSPALLPGASEVGTGGGQAGCRAGVAQGPQAVPPTPRPPASAQQLGPRPGLAPMGSQGLQTGSGVAASCVAETPFLLGSLVPDSLGMEAGVVAATPADAVGQPLELALTGAAGSQAHLAGTHRSAAPAQRPPLSGQAAPPSGAFARPGRRHLPALLSAGAGASRSPSTGPLSAPPLPPLALPSAGPAGAQGSIPLPVAAGAVAEVRLPGPVAGLLGVGSYLAAAMPAPAQGDWAASPGGAGWQLVVFGVDAHGGSMRAEGCVSLAEAHPPRSPAAAAAATLLAAAAPATQLVLLAPTSDELGSGASSGAPPLLLAAAAPLLAQVAAAPAQQALHPTCRGVNLYQLGGQLRASSPEGVPRTVDLAPAARGHREDGWLQRRGKSAALPDELAEPGQAGAIGGGSSTPGGGSMQPSLALALRTGWQVQCLATCGGVLLAAGGAEGAATVWRLHSPPAGGPPAAGLAALALRLEAEEQQLPPAAYKGIPFTDLSELAFVAPAGGSSGGGGGGASTARSSSPPAPPARGCSAGGAAGQLLVGLSQQGLLAVWDVGRRQLLCAVYDPGCGPIRGLLPVQAELPCPAQHLAVGGTAAAPPPSQHPAGAAGGHVAAAPALGGPPPPPVLLAQVGETLAPIVLLRGGQGVHMGTALGAPAGLAAVAVQGSMALAASAGGLVQAWDVVEGGRRLQARCGAGCSIGCARMLTGQPTAALGSADGHLLLLGLR